MLTLKKTVITLRSYSNKVKKRKIYPKQGVISLEMCFSFRISAEGPVGIIAELISIFHRSLGGITGTLMNIT